MIMRTKRVLKDTYKEFNERGFKKSAKCWKRRGVDYDYNRSLFIGFVCCMHVCLHDLSRSLGHRDVVVRYDVRRIFLAIISSRGLLIACEDDDTVDERGDERSTI